MIDDNGTADDSFLIGAPLKTVKESTSNRRAEEASDDNANVADHP